MAGALDILYQAMSAWEQEDYDREGRAILEPIKAISGASEPVTRDRDVATGTVLIFMGGE